jgi:hypothetical protein
VNTGSASSINTSSFATTGSNIFSGSQTITGSLNVSQGITGSLLGTASNATSASYALTASYAANAGIPTGVPKIYQITVNMNGGSIDPTTPIASVLGPNGENIAALTGSGWSFSYATPNTINIGRPTGFQVQPLVNIQTHGNNAGQVFTKAPSSNATTGYATMQTLSGGAFVSASVTSITTANTGCAPGGTTTVWLTFGLIS